MWAAEPGLMSTAVSLVNDSVVWSERHQKPSKVGHHGPRVMAELAEASAIGKSNSAFHAHGHGSRAREE